MTPIGLYSIVVSLIVVLVAGAANLPAQPAASQEVADEPSLESIEGTHTWTLTRELPLQKGGSLSLRNENGQILVVHTDTLSASSSIYCKTSNGKVDLSLGKGSSFDLEAHTSNGHISTDFPVTVSGKISKTHLSGKVGEGGAKVNLHTSNGSISIKRT